jgi:hypothetical protein
LQGGTPIDFAHRGDERGLFVPHEPDANQVHVRSLPRIGLYAPWRGNMDEGWTRYVLDTWEVPYMTVRNEMLRAGNLGDFLDVLVIPSISGGQLEAGRRPGTAPDEYTRGLAPEGAVAVEEFVRRGGTLITFGSSSQWAIDLMRVPLVDVTREEGNREFSCPGSVLRGVPVMTQAITADLPESMPLFFSRSAAWRTMTEDEAKDREPASRVTVLMNYAPTHVLLSGWIKEPQIIEGRIAWARARYGAGRVHLFAFRPQYRAWSQSTFPLIFRSMLLK